MTPERRVTAFAPASVGNVAVGFDILGHALAEPGDRITARRRVEPGVTIETITGCVTDLPCDAERNAAGAAVWACLFGTGGYLFGAAFTRTLEHAERYEEWAFLVIGAVAALTVLILRLRARREAR